MNKMLMALFLMICTAGAAHAGLKTVGKGDSLHFDPSSWPPAMKTNYDIMKVRCVKCHTLERTVVAIQTGVAPISGQPFDRGATKAYGIKMMRKPDSNMSKPEIKATVDLMNWMLTQVEH